MTRPTRSTRPATIRRSTRAASAALPLVPAYRAFLPVSVDVTSHMPPAGRQGKLSSCTAWAVAYAARSYYI
jgi:hypothetical protein